MIVVQSKLLYIVTVIDSVPKMYFIIILTIK